MDLRYKNFGKNTLLTLGGNAGSKIIGMLMLPLYTKWLTVEEFGVTDIINVYSLFILGFVSLCISDAIFVYPKNADEVKMKQYFTTGLVFSFCAIAISSFLFYGVTKAFLLCGKSNVFSENAWLIFGMMAATFLQNYTQQFTMSINKMVIYSITGVVNPAFTALFSFMFIPCWGIKGYVFSIILAQICASIYSFVFSKSYKYFDIKFIDRNSLLELLKYSIPLLPNGIMFWLVNGMNRPLMEHYAGLYAIGLLAVANKFPGILSSLSSIMGNAWSISMLEEFHKPDFNKLFNNLFKSIMLVIFIGSCVIAVSSKWLIGLFAAPEYKDAYMYVPLLTLGVVFNHAGGLIGGIFGAAKKSKYFFYTSFWGALTSVLAMSALIPTMKIFGAVMAITISFFVMTIARLKYAWRHIHGFDIPFYINLIAINMAFCIIVPSNFEMHIKIISYILLFGYLIYTNLEYLHLLKTKIIHKLL